MKLMGGKKDDASRIPDEVEALLRPHFSDVRESLRDIKKLIEHVRAQISSSQNTPAGEPGKGVDGSGPEAGHAGAKDHTQPVSNQQDFDPVSPDKAQPSAHLSSVANEDTELQLAKLRIEVERLGTELVITKGQLNKEIADGQNWANSCQNERDAAVRERDEFRSNAEHFEAVAKDYEEKAVELEKQISSLNNQAGLGEEELRQARQKLEECQNQLQECSEKLAQAKQELEDRDNRIATYNQKVAELDGVMATLQHEKTEHVAERDALIHENETLTQDKLGLLAEKQNLTKQLLANEKLESLMWPEFLSKPEMLSWRESIQQEILQDEPNDSIVLMVACLFSYNAAVRMGKDWQKRLIDVLYDFSFAFFRWNKDRMVSNGEAVNNANLWAGAFNTSCKGLVKIFVPEPDEPFDKRSMVSYQGTGGPSLDVESVRSWCIQDESGRIMKQAEVTTR